MRWLIRCRMRRRYWDVRHAWPSRRRCQRASRPATGCVGNLIYTGIADDEFYSVIAGKDLASVVAQLETITSANAALAEYHTGRRAALSTA